ncbi:hypothetical protein BDZ89DRAFT_1126904 [Hymenopellis radicata]|nr:hypothetical protein BDZ89DRAFT_1126904 [Hymenopellis radicata]
MFARFPTLVIASLVVLASASSYAPASGYAPAKEAPNCLIGTAQCCNKVEGAASSRTVNALLGLLGTVLEVLDVQVGITCAGVDEDPECRKGEFVCCLDNSYDGVISVGCHTPSQWELPSGNTY